MHVLAALHAGLAVPREVVCDVLAQRAAARHVQHLRPATNRKQRERQLDCCRAERELELVAQGDHTVGLRCRRLAVARRVHIATAGQHQSVEPVQHRDRFLVVEMTRTEHRFLRARPLQRLHVHRLDCERRIGPAVDATRHHRVRGQRDERRGNHETRHQICSKLRCRSQSVTTRLNVAHSCFAVFNKW